ncbi:Cyclin-dependent kinase B2-1 [Acorus gramineus]|uniref:Cyclin-dependent kinase B2-1 n=1 Tax=Acorus gramineus TaxID=55184 RepID=A0AAV9ASK6_ACOGR|nr:Cyclin-dependent kinase B2-1 [Acorus gramineus]
MDAYEKLEKVGEGTYGKVYRARERATGKIIALKKQRLHGDDEGVPPTTLREVSLLKMLSSDPHVVRSFCMTRSICFGQCRLLGLKQCLNKEGKTVLYLVFEYMDTDLKKYIRSSRKTGQTFPLKTVKVRISVSSSVLNFLNKVVFENCKIVGIMLSPNCCGKPPQIGLGLRV